MYFDMAIKDSADRGLVIDAHGARLLVLIEKLFTLQTVSIFSKMLQDTATNQTEPPTNTLQ